MFRTVTSFPKAVISLTDEGDEYRAEFRAGIGYFITNHAIHAVLACLFFFYVSGFNWLGLLMAIPFFALAVIIDFIETNITFPVYFVSLRNDIERQIASNRDKQAIK